MFGDPTFWVGVGFVIFLGVVVYFKVPSMIAMALDERSQRIKSELEEARRLREEAQALLAEYQRKQHEAQKEADDIVAQAREDAEAYAREARAKLAESLERRQRLAEEKIARAEADAVNEVRARAAEIAVAAAGRLIAEGLPDAKAKSLIDDGVEAVRDKLN